MADAGLILEITCGRRYFDVRIQIFERSHFNGAVPNPLVSTVVLQSDETVCNIAFRGIEVVDQNIVEENLDVLALDTNLVTIPETDRIECGVPGSQISALELVHRTGGLVVIIGGVDLDFVSIFNCDPRVTRVIATAANVREADEDAAVVVEIGRASWRAGGWGAE